MTRLVSRISGSILFMSLIIAVSLTLKAIWTHGPDAGRWGGTGAVFFVIALGSGFVLAITYESEEERQMREQRMERRARDGY